MNTLYSTSGVLSRPLITLHTLRDQQVPYWHEPLYDLKTLFSGSLFIRHLEIPLDRFGHCNFTKDEALFSFVVMLVYDAVLDGLTGTATFLSPPELAAFEKRAQAIGLPSRRAGTALAITLKPREN
jgi:hypothetical protein